MKKTSCEETGEECFNLLNNSATQNCRYAATTIELIPFIELPPVKNQEVKLFMLSLLLPNP